MKKSIIALAVAGAMTVPMIAQADATLFGEARYDVSKKKDGKLGSDITRIRFGVKGEETMDSGLTAGFFLRFDGTGDVGPADANDNGTKGVDTQKAALYIAGDFGKVVFGQADSPAALVEDRTAYVSISGDELGVIGNEWNHSGISYETNSMNGLKFAVGMGNVGTSDTVGENGYGAMVSYDTDSFGVTVGAGKDASSLTVDGESHAGISAEYKFSQGAVGLSYTDEDTVDYVAVSGKYSIDKLTLAAQFETQTTSVTGSPDVKKKSSAVSAAYSLGGNAAVAVAYVNFNDVAENAGSADKTTLRYSLSF